MNKPKKAQPAPAQVVRGAVRGLGGIAFTIVVQPLTEAQVAELDAQAGKAAD